MIVYAGKLTCAVLLLINAYFLLEYDWLVVADIFISLMLFWYSFSRDDDDFNTSVTV